MVLRPTYLDVGSAELCRERSRPTPKHETFLTECHPGTWMYPAANAARAEQKSHFLLGSTTLVTGPLTHILCSAAFVRPCTSESDGSFHTR